MQNILVVGITGKMGSGKDTLATALTSELSKANVFTRPFAGPLKRACEELFGVPCWTQEDKTRLVPHAADFAAVALAGHRDMLGNCDSPVTVRRALQYVGTEVGRQLFHPDFWLLRMQTELDKIQRAYGQEQRPIIVFIPDVRFDNEADFCRERGFLIHITNMNQPPTPVTHVSEAGVTPMTDDLISSYSSVAAIHRDAPTIANAILQSAILINDITQRIKS